MTGVGSISKGRDSASFVLRLESLGGAAAMTVAIGHTFRVLHAEGAQRVAAGWIDKVFDGNAAVTLFFVLSGFVRGLFDWTSALRERMPGLPVARCFDGLSSCPFGVRWHRMQRFQFHPVIARWFEQKFGTPTRPQEEGWPAIQSGSHTLIAAPTGSGKTLAAFLCALDALFREGLTGPLPDETRVLYVSPLKALSNDIHKNLLEPLAGIREALQSSEGRDVHVRAEVRTGDTPAAKQIGRAHV